MASEEARDWRTGLSVLERQRYMYEGKYASDVTLEVGKVNQEKIAAHRFVLVCGSPVFEAMLTDGSEGDIVVQDVEPEVFNEMLKFLYCEQIELKVDTAWYVLQAARKYEMSQLVVQCTDYLMGTIDITNVCPYLTKSVQCDENELSAGFMEFISHNIKQVLDSPEFTQVSHQILKRILESDITFGVSPRELYTACLRWADAHCAVDARALTDEIRRAVLGSCLYLIRFIDMSTKDFIEVTRESKLLTNEERLHIFEYKAYREHGYEYESSMVFNVRKPKEHRVTRLTRDCVGTPSVFGHGVSSEPRAFTFGALIKERKSAIDFQCSRSVWITGVGLYIDDGVVNNVVVKLMDDKGKVLADTGDVAVKYDLGNTIDVRFPENIRIHGNQFYRITAEYKGKHNRYGTSGRITVENGGITFNFKQTPGNETTVYEGQIPEIIFAT